MLLVECKLKTGAVRYVTSFFDPWPLESTRDIGKIKFHQNVEIIIDSGRRQQDFGWRVFFECQ